MNAESVSLQRTAKEFSEREKAICILHKIVLATEFHLLKAQQGGLVVWGTVS